MKKIFFLLLLPFAITSIAIAQNETFRLTKPDLIKCNLVRVSPALRTLSNAKAPEGPNYRGEFTGIDRDKDESGMKLHPVLNPNALPKGISPATQLIYNYSSESRTRAAINLQFEGLGYSFVNPSDNNLASGPNHIVQMINRSSGSLIRIWDKAGNILVNSVILSSITGVSGLGDPVVLYDQLADRYLISEFGNVGNRIIVAVSQTNDPTGGYYVYNYTTPNFPDYFKLATWGNSYIVTSNENSPAIYALDRTKMLAGTATTFAQRFIIPKYPTIGFQAATPVDVVGSTDAPPGSPALFMRMADDAWTTGITDRLEIFSLSVDWTTPSNTSLTGPALLPTLPFSTNFCGYLTFSCVPQQGSSVKLDPLREVLMNKISYRNFGTYEAIVCTHIDELNGNSHAGVRWYELRKTPPATNWVIYQQGTYGAPADPLHRWMSCIAINADNSIGLGYNVAGPTSYPSIRFTGRKACDPLGVMPEPEQTVVSGSAPNASFRYGDYNSMTVDPVNGSFWMTANYNPTSQWATRVANFSISNDCCIPPSISSIAAVNNPICIGTTTNLTTVGVSGTNAVVTWYSEPGGTGTALGTGLSLNNVEAGTYYARVTGDCGTPVEAFIVITNHPAVSASIPDVYAVNPGGSANTIFIGYGPASPTLTAVPAGGTPGFTYSWTPGGSTSASLDVSPATVGSYVYTVTVTDSKGCMTTASKTINVVDIRCGNKNKNVTVCHVPPGNPGNARTICVGANAVADHLLSGSYLGSCIASIKMINPELVNASSPKAQVYPNPTAGQFDVQLPLLKSAKAEIVVMNANGTIIERRAVKAIGQIEKFDLRRNAAGMYFIRIVSEEGVENLKVNVQR